MKDEAQPNEDKIGPQKSISKSKPSKTTTTITLGPTSDKLKWWIEGTTNLATIAGQEVVSGFGWSLYDHVLKLLTSLFPTLIHLSPVNNKTDNKYLKIALGNLFLWGDGFRNGGLDYVLNESYDLQETVVELLVSIGKLLTTSK